MKFFNTTFFFLFFYTTISAQSNKIDSLLNAIVKLQSKEDSFYPAGAFPSQRGKHQLKEDNTIFFTSSIAFTLKNNKTNLSKRNQKRVDSICIQAISNYKRYQNKTGIFTYNFWQTNPPQYFPNSHFYRIIPILIFRMI
jgi:hypothetical protein